MSNPNANKPRSKQIVQRFGVYSLSESGSCCRFKRTAWDLASVACCAVILKEQTSAIPVPEKVFSAMRRCGAGIIVVSVDETRKDKPGNYTINENALIEIGAAFVLYDKRVVLLWDKRLSVPSNLQGLYDASSKAMS